MISELPPQHSMWSSLSSSSPVMESLPLHMSQSAVPRHQEMMRLDQEVSPVVIVYNLDAERFNCKRLFNLLSLYGNVNKINFIRKAVK